MELLFADKDIPYLGVQASTVTDKIASTYRIPKGIYIKEVDMDSPAMNAGLQSGDVIVKLAGKDVTTVASYSEIVLGLEPGENYKIVIKREGSSVRFLQHGRSREREPLYWHLQKSRKMKKQKMHLQKSRVSRPEKSLTIVSKIL